MQIKIIRPTVAMPTGGAAKAVNVGEILTVDAMQAEQLIQLHKAVAWEGDPQLATPEQTLPPSEKRSNKRRK